MVSADLERESGSQAEDPDAVLVGIQGRIPQVLQVRGQGDLARDVPAVEQLGRVLIVETRRKRALVRFGGCSRLPSGIWAERELARGFWGWPALPDTCARLAGGSGLFLWGERDP